MKLSHMLIAGTAFLSFGALAEGNTAAKDSAAHSGSSAAMQQEAQPSASVIKQVQQKLSAAGHDAGPADGVMGAKSQQALKDFQQSKGLEANGQIDQRTLAALGIGTPGVGATPSAGPEHSLEGSSKPTAPSGSSKY